MGAYYYCKFSRDDERKAILDRDFCAKKTLISELVE